MGLKLKGAQVPFKDKDRAREYFKQYDDKRSERRKSGGDDDKYAKYGRHWYDSNREELLATRLNGIKLPEGDRKRPFLGFCELCGRNIVDGQKKAYHHWDDEMPAMGMWVCYLCHKTAEGVDSGTVEKYLSLKREIERKYAIEQLRKIGIEVGDDWRQ